MSATGIFSILLEQKPGRGSKKQMLLVHARSLFRVFFRIFIKTVDYSKTVANFKAGTGHRKCRAGQEHDFSSARPSRQC